MSQGRMEGLAELIGAILGGGGEDVMPYNPAVMEKMQENVERHRSW